MSSLIIYATKYGATKQIVDYMENRLEDVEIWNIKDGIPRIGEYDCVIIGGSIYMNKIQKSIASFLKKNETELMKKQIGLFISCYTPEGTEGYLGQFFLPSLVKHAKSIGILGGLMQYDKMNVIYRKLFQSLKKIDGFNKEFKEPKIEEEAIDRFIAPFLVNHNEF